MYRHMYTFSNKYVQFFTNEIEIDVFQETEFCVNIVIIHI